MKREMEGCMYVIAGLNPVVLVCCHVEFFEDITRFADLKDFDACCIAEIELKIMSVYLFVVKGLGELTFLVR